MANNDELKKLEEIRKIKELISRLNAQDQEFYRNFLNNLNESVNSLSDFQKLTELVEKDLNNINVDSDYLVSNFKKLVGEIGRSNEGIKSTQSGFKSLSSIAEQLVNYQRGYNNLSSEDLKKLEKKIGIEKDKLKNTQNLLQTEEANLRIKLQQAIADNEELRTINSIRDTLNKNLIAQKQIKESVTGQNSDLTNLLKTLSKTQDQALLFEKTMGLSGAAAGALKETLNTLGLGKLGTALGLDKAFEAATEKAKELSDARLRQIQLKKEELALETLIARKRAAGVAEYDNLIVNLQNKLKINRELQNSTSLFNDKLKVLTTYLKEAGKGLSKTLSDPLFYITQIVTAFKSLDDGIGQFAKNMNYSYQDAAKLNSKFIDMANSSGDIAVTTKGIRDTMMAMGQAMGSNAILNEKDAVTFTKLREQAGLANEELTKMQELTLVTGGNLEDNTKNLLGAANITAMNNGVLLNEKEILKEIAKTSNATKLSLNGSTEALGKAAAQAKALGMSLEQVDKIADSLLQIETSISNELEAELLTGRNLNLEGARLAALNNDMEGLSKEIAKNYGTAAEFSKMNRIQQEAAAKAVGMSREELAGTLVRAEALKSMSGEQAEKAKQAFDTRVKEVGLEQAQKELKDGQLQKMMQQQSIQERFVQATEKLKELFISLVDPLMPLLDTLTGILGVVGKIVGFLGNFAPAILAAVAAVKIFKAVQKSSLLMSMGKAIMDVISSNAVVPIIGTALGLAAAGTIATLGYKYMQGNDIMSPGYGKRTLMGPEGAIALNDKDTVIAGTNLFDKKGDDVISEPGKNTSIKSEGAINTSNVDITPLIAEMQAVKAVLNQILSKESAIYMDSTKVGTAINVGTSKIQ